MVGVALPETWRNCMENTSLSSGVAQEATSQPLLEHAVLYLYQLLILPRKRPNAFHSFFPRLNVATFHSPFTFCVYLTATNCSAGMRMRVCQESLLCYLKQLTGLLPVSLRLPHCEQITCVSDLWSLLAILFHALASWQGPQQHDTTEQSPGTLNG